MSPQTEAVLALLRRAGAAGITQEDAIREIRCFRLAARVAALKAEGVEVRTVLEGTNGHRWARYFAPMPKPLEQPVQMAAGF
jgi:hypothetical protein